MDLYQNTLSQLNVTLNELFSNPYVAALFSIMVIFYAGLAAPQLPAPIANLFDFTLFKMFILALILFVNNYNQTIAILVAVAFFLSLQTLSQLKIGNMAKHMGYMRQAMNNEENGEEANVEEAPYSLGMADYNGDAQVSGLANRTVHYQGPQGMKQPVGFGGFEEGADIMY